MESAMRERPFETGDYVEVSGAAGKVVGEVLEARAVEEFPDLGAEAHSTEAFEVFREWGIDFAALITYWDGKQDVSFFALRHPGGWRDLGGQDLTVSKVASSGGGAAA
jgi:hypothetical protein